MAPLLLHINYRCSNAITFHKNSWGLIIDYVLECITYYDLGIPRYEKEC